MCRSERQKMDNSDTADAIDPWWIAEFCCWTMVILAPLLTWVNGPAVSTDRFVVRTVVSALSLTGAICLRVTNIVRNKPKKRECAQ